MKLSLHTLSEIEKGVNEIALTLSDNVLMPTLLSSVLVANITLPIVMMIGNLA